MVSPELGVSPPITPATASRRWSSQRCRPSRLRGRSTESSVRLPRRDGPSGRYGLGPPAGQDERHWRAGPNSRRRRLRGVHHVADGTPPQPSRVAGPRGRGTLFHPPDNRPDVGGGREPGPHLDAGCGDRHLRRGRPSESRLRGGPVNEGMTSPASGGGELRAHPPGGEEVGRLEVTFERPGANLRPGASTRTRPG